MSNRQQKHLTYTVLIQFWLLSNTFFCLNTLTWFFLHILSYIMNIFVYVIKLELESLYYKLYAQDDKGVLGHC
jgi:hypothetical protein